MQTLQLHAAMLKLFKGRVPQLLRHPNGALVIDDAYNAAYPAQRDAMAAEFYGKEFTLFQVIEWCSLFSESAQELISTRHCPALLTRVTRMTTDNCMCLHLTPGQRASVTEGGAGGGGRGEEATGAAEHVAAPHPHHGEGHRRLAAVPQACLHSQQLLQLSLEPTSSCNPARTHWPVNVTYLAMVTCGPSRGAAVH